MIKKTILGLCTLFLIFTFYPVQVNAQQLTELTLTEAIELAFAENLEYQLALWELSLNEREMDLNQRPTPEVSVNTRPIAKHLDGTLQSPSGEITLNMPISDHSNLTSKISMSLSSDNVDVEPSGAISYDYSFFNPVETREESVLDQRVVVDNSLILEVTDALISLAKSREGLDLAEFQFAYLEQSLTAAEVRNDTSQTLILKQKVRTAEQQLDDLAMKIKEQNQALNRILGQSDIDFLPIILISDDQVVLESDKLVQQALTNSNELINAINIQTKAQQQLAATQRSHGWDITADARLEWDFDLKNNPTWSMNLSASRDLFPPSLQQEKDELALAKAEMEIENTEHKIISQTNQYLETIELLQDRYISINENIIEELQALEETKILYEAGLVTELELTKHQEDIASLNLDLQHNQYDYLSTLLRLFNHCGYQLIELVGPLTAEEVYNESDR